MFDGADGDYLVQLHVATYAHINFGNTARKHKKYYFKLIFTPSQDQYT